MTVKDLHELFNRLTMFDFEYETGHRQRCFNDGRYLRKYYDYVVQGKLDVVEDIIKFKCRIKE
jgi:hypothetical protein